MRQQCVGLLAGEEHDFGLSLLEKSSSLENGALEQLKEWSLQLCRTQDLSVLAEAGELNGEEDEEAAGVHKGLGQRRPLSEAAALRKSLHLLCKSRPAAVRALQEAVISGQRGFFVKRFLTALTGKAPTSSQGTAGGGGGGGGVAQQLQFSSKEDAEDDYQQQQQMQQRGSSHTSSHSSSSSSGSRPMDADAHDSQRWLGDMLAWLHLNLAELGELFSSLFPSAASASSLSASLSASSSSNAAALQRSSSLSSTTAPSSTPTVEGGEEASLLSPSQMPLSVPQMLLAVTEQLARPLLLRVQQALQSATALASPVAALKQADMLSHYRSTLHRLLAVDLSTPAAASPASAAAPSSSSSSAPAPPAAPPSQLLAGLDSCRALSLTVYADSVRAWAASVSSRSSGASLLATDLTALSLISSTARQLAEVCRAAGPGEAMSLLPSEERLAEQCLDVMLPLLLGTVQQQAGALPPAQAHVFQLNNLSALLQALSLAGTAGAGAGRGGNYSSTAAASSSSPLPQAEWQRKLQQQMGQTEEALTKLLANEVLTGSGLLAKLSLLRSLKHLPASSPLRAQKACQMPGLTSSDVVTVTKGFLRIVATGAHLGALQQLSDPQQKSRLRKQAGSVLQAAFSAVLAELEEPSNGYVAPPASAAAAGGSAVAAGGAPPPPAAAASMEALLGSKPSELLLLFSEDPF